jgi:DNA (cytosine-5)-methyltransferase 1
MTDCLQAADALVESIESVQPSFSPALPPSEPSAYEEQRLQLLAAITRVGSPAGVVKGDREAGKRCVARVFNGAVEDEALNGVMSSIGARHCHALEPACSICPLASFCNYGRQAAQQPNGVHFADLFCGAGGLSLGLEHEGFWPAVAVDSDQSACRTYRFNRPALKNEQVICDTMLNVLASRRIPEVPVLVGGPPCQGFSTANRQRLSEDPRNELYREYIEALRVSKAEIALLENVTGMRRALPRMVQDFRDLGFEIFPFQLNSKEFGLPQNRGRLFILCVRARTSGSAASIANAFDRSLRSILKVDASRKPYVLSDAIGDLPSLRAKTVRNATALETPEFGFTVAWADNAETQSYVGEINGHRPQHFLLNHRSKFNNPRDVEIFSRLRPGEKSDAESIKDIMPYARRSDIFKDKFYRLRMADACKTITAHMYFDCHMYIHPEQARGLTPREAARVQGFPDDYFFLGYPNEWYRQIGNAVSPPVAERLGKALMSAVSASGIKCS